MQSKGLPHAWLAIMLSSLIIGAMVMHAAQQRWADPFQQLFGEFGLATVVTGLLTLTFLGWRAYVGHLALLNTQKTLEHAQRAELATRFQKGMEMLGHANEATRIGGLYILRDVATALPEVYWASVVDSLLPFIRTACEPQTRGFREFMSMLDRDEEPDETQAWLDTTPQDAVVAIRIVGRGWPELQQATANHELDSIRFRDLTIANVTLRDLDFEAANFDGAVFQNVMFNNCKLSFAEMNIRASRTRFRNCTAIGANIFTNFVPFGPSDVQFRDCNISEATIDGHQISEMALENCDLRGAQIDHPQVNVY